MSPTHREELCRDLTDNERIALSAHGEVKVPMDEWILLIIDKVTRTAIQVHSDNCPYRRASDTLSVKSWSKVMVAAGAMAAAVVGAMKFLVGK